MKGKTLLVRTLNGFLVAQMLGAFAVAPVALLAPVGQLNDKMVFFAAHISNYLTIVVIFVIDCIWRGTSLYSSLSVFWFCFFVPFFFSFLLHAYAHLRQQAFLLAVVMPTWSVMQWSAWRYHFAFIKKNKIAAIIIILFFCTM